VVENDGIIVGDERENGVERRRGSRKYVSFLGKEIRKE
jgi:hypothetical protein